MSYLKAAEHGLVLWADVRAATERGNSHCVAVQDWQVVAVSTVCMFLKVIFSRNFKSVDI